MEDLEQLIEDDSIKIKNIIIKDDTVINNDVIKQIGKNKVTFNCSSDNVNYYWVIDGSKATGKTEFSTLIKFSNSDEKLDRITNYSKGIYLEFSHSGKLPEGTNVIFPQSH